MNKDISKLFAAVADNHIVCFDSTLKGFAERFKVIESKAPAYVTLFRKFKETDYFTQHIAGKEYHFQKVI